MLIFFGKCRACQRQERRKESGRENWMKSNINYKFIVATNFPLMIKLSTTTIKKSFNTFTPSTY